jgi:hypothetical protein
MVRPPTRVTSEGVARGTFRRSEVIRRRANRLPTLQVTQPRPA